MSVQPVIVAIDGPAASGKSTISRLVAEALGFYHVDTGSMYRALAWKALEEGIDPKKSDDVIALLQRVRFECDFHQDDSGIFCLRNRLDGHDPGNAIRAPRIEAAVSLVAAIPEVRAAMVQKQRALISQGDLVMEGRDIGSVVFPETPFKFYLDADAKVRAERRAVDQSAKGKEISVEQALIERDHLDRTRKVAPLKMADDAIRVDTSHLDVRGTADIVLKHIRSLHLRFSR